MNKCTWRNSFFVRPGNRNTINFCLALTSLENLNKVNFPSLILGKKNPKHITGAIPNNVLTFSAVLERVGRGVRCAGTALSIGRKKEEVQSFFTIKPTTENNPLCWQRCDRDAQVVLKPGRTVSCAPIFQFLFLEWT